MPRKFNDPIMKSKNALTNGETSSKSNQSSSAESQKPGYTPASIKDGIDFSDLSESLKNLGFGDITIGPKNENWDSLKDYLNSLKDQLQNVIPSINNLSYDFNFQSQQGDILSNLINILNQNGGYNFNINGGNNIGSMLGLFSAIGGGSNISLMDDANCIWLQMPISNRRTTGGKGIWPAISYSLNILLDTIRVDAAAQKIIVDGREFSSFFAARRVGMEQGYSTTTSGNFFQPFHSSEYTSLTPGYADMYKPEELASATLNFSFVTGATALSPYISNGYADEILSVPFPTGGASTELKHVTMADSPLTYISLGDVTVSSDPPAYATRVYNYSVYNMDVSTMRIYIKDES